jgi:hypothetical protein
MHDGVLAVWLNLWRRRRFVTISTDTVLPVPNALPGNECLCIRVTNDSPAVLSIQSVGIRVGGSKGALVLPPEWLRYDFPVSLEAGERWCAPLVPTRTILRNLNAQSQMRFWWGNCWRLSASVETDPHGHCTAAFLLPNEVAGGQRTSQRPDEWQPPPLWS